MKLKLKHKNRCRCFSKIQTLCNIQKLKSKCLICTKNIKNQPRQIVTLNQFYKYRFLFFVFFLYNSQYSIIFYKDIKNHSRIFVLINTYSSVLLHNLINAEVKSLFPYQLYACKQAYFLIFLSICIEFPFFFQL